MDILSLNKINIVFIAILFFQACKKEVQTREVSSDNFSYPFLIEGFENQEIQNATVYLKKANQKVIDSGYFKIINQGKPAQAMIRFHHSNLIAPKDSILIQIRDSKSFITALEEIPVESRSKGSSPFVLQYNLNGKVYTEDEEAVISNTR